MADRTGTERSHLNGAGHDSTYSAEVPLSSENDEELEHTRLLHGDRRSGRARRAEDFRLHRAYDALREAEATHRDMVRGLTAAISRTREEQSRFLHGSVLQTLEALCSLEFDAEHVPLLRRQARRDIIQIRSFLAGLDPMASDDFERELQDLVDEAADRSLQVEVVREDLEAGAYTLTPQAIEAVSFAIREALTNVSKHAGVPSATIRITRQREWLRLAVADSGRGFNPDEANRAGHFGLRQTRQALAAEGGTVEIDTAAYGGTVIRLAIRIASE